MKVVSLLPAATGGPNRALYFQHGSRLKTPIQGHQIAGETRLILRVLTLFGHSCRIGSAGTQRALQTGGFKRRPKDEGNSRIR